MKTIPSTGAAEAAQDKLLRKSRMKTPATLALLVGLCGFAWAGEAGFATKPFVRKAGKGYVITFAAKAKCDAAVSVIGPDGKIVRHLVAGVLGPNAPTPFAKGSLSQKLEWDGLDDRGKPVPAGCKVRVGLGLKASFDRFLGYDEMAVNFMSGIACGPDGNVYLSMFRHNSGDASAGTRMTVLSRKGKYLRTIMPYPANMPLDKIKGLRCHKSADGRLLPIVEEQRGGFYPHMRYSPRQVMAVTKDGKIAFVGGGIRAGRGRKFNLRVIGTDGSTPTGSFFGPLIGTTATRKAQGAFFAVSPDDKTVYASFQGRLVKMGWSGNEPAKPFGPKTLKDARGVAVDAKGQVYVASPEAGKVLVLSPEGAETRSIVADAPDAIAVHPKNGSIYVLTSGRKMIKFTPDGKVLATLKLPPAPKLRGGEHHNKSGRIMALDGSAEPPIVWIGNAVKGSPLWRVTDRGDSFEKEDMKDRIKDKSPGVGAPPIHIAAEQARDRVYVRRGFSLLVRYDGATGKGVKINIPLKRSKPWAKWERIFDILMGADGNLWVAWGSKQRRIARVNPDGKLVPFASGKPFITLPKGSMPDNRGSMGDVWSPGFGVTGNGEILSFAPLRRKVWTLDLIGPDGKLKKAGFISGLPDNAGCPRVDRAGNVYVGMHTGRFSPTMTKMFKTAGGGYGFEAGQVFKFSASGDVFGTKSKKGESEGELWDYSGFSPRYSYKRVNDGECSCLVAGFNLDGFDRVFVPDALLFTVHVLDSNGNRIMDVGSYGNPDSRGPKSQIPTPEIPFWFPTHTAANDWALYVSDYAAGRVVRIKLGYHAEETVSVP